MGLDLALLDDGAPQAAPESTGGEPPEESAACPLEDVKTPDIEPETPAEPVAAPEAESGEEAPADAASADAEPPLAPGFTAELKGVLSYIDELLEALPEDKIEEFARSEQFDHYKKVFQELGIG